MVMVKVSRRSRVNSAVVTRQVTTVTRNQTSSSHGWLQFDRNVNRLNIVPVVFSCSLDVCSLRIFPSVPFLSLGIAAIFTAVAFRRKVTCVVCVRSAFFFCQVSTAFFFFFRGPLNRISALLSDELFRLTAHDNGGSGLSGQKAGAV